MFLSKISLDSLLFFLQSRGDMKIFKIITRRGFFSIPERIAGYSFPPSVEASFEGATQFPFRAAAEKTIKKYHLFNPPISAHIEEFDF